MDTNPDSRGADPGLLAPFASPEHRAAILAVLRGDTSNLDQGAACDAMEFLTALAREVGVPSSVESGAAAVKAALTWRARALTEAGTAAAPLVSPLPETAGAVFDRDRVLDLLQPEVHALRRAFFPHIGTDPPFAVSVAIEEAGSAREGLVLTLRAMSRWIEAHVAGQPTRSPEEAAQGARVLALAETVAAFGAWTAGVTVAGMATWMSPLWLVWAAPTPTLTAGRPVRTVGNALAFRSVRVVPASVPGAPPPPLWRLAEAAADWEQRTGIFRGHWPSYVLGGIPPPLLPAEIRVTPVPLTRDGEGPIRTEATLVLHDPDLTRAQWIRLHRALRAMLGVTQRRKLADDDPGFLRRVRAIAEAHGARGPFGGPPTEFDGAFWKAYNARFKRYARTVRALGMRWQALTKKLARREAASRAATPERRPARAPGRAGSARAGSPRRRARRIP